jgi:hypothetical protein
MSDWRVIEGDSAEVLQGPEYVAIAEARIAHAQAEPQQLVLDTDA